MKNALFFSILAALLCRFLIIFNYEINWDEFYYLNQLYLYNADKLSWNLQTFYVYLFGWLEWFSYEEFIQIIIIRAAMLILQGATAFFIYKIGQHYFTKSAGLFCALSYLCFNYVIWQGTSFRMDPIITFLLISALYTIICQDLTKRNALLAGTLIAIAAAITVKSIFYLPTIGGILLFKLMQSENKKQTLIYGVILSLSTIGLFGALYFFHHASLTVEQTTSTTDILANNYQYMINFDNLFPRSYYFKDAFIGNLIFWIAVVIGTILCFFTSPKKNAQLFLFLLPLFTLIFYRNAYPYYYVFMIAPLSILCGYYWQWLEERKNILFNIILFISLLLYLGNIFIHGVLRPFEHSMATQKDVIAETHKIFPEPSSYIDRCGMIPEFSSETGFFMSTLGINKYRQKNKTIISNNIKSKKPIFILANIAQLDLDKRTFLQDVTENQKLLEGDIKALQGNYIHHWGPIYIAGKNINFNDLQLKKEINIIIDGVYTIESKNPIHINNKLYQPFEIIKLKQGKYIFEVFKSDQEVILRWGEHLYKPSISAPDKPLFTTF